VWPVPIWPAQGKLRKTKKRRNRCPVAKPGGVPLWVNFFLGTSFNAGSTVGVGTRAISRSYTYQREHRFCWLPATATTRLEHIDVEVGSLKEIAELIVL